MTLPETLDGRRLPLPKRWATRPRDPRGWPVPWFVAEVAPGQFNFRVADERKRTKAVRENRCWLCGETLGRFKCFAIGPMCAINRISSEPPSHVECAEYAVRACPFLTRPHAKRREAGLPEKGHNPGGISLDRNPGVTLLWVSVRYTTFRTSAADGPGIATGWLINVGDPEAVRAYAEGRVATRAEVDHAIETGYPLLRCEAERQGPDAVLALARIYRERKAALDTQLWTALDGRRTGT